MSAAGRRARDRWVVCYEYAAGPYDADRAVRELAAIARGGRCYGEHQIVVSARKPEVAASAFCDDEDEG